MHFRYSISESSHNHNPQKAALVADHQTYYEYKPSPHLHKPSPATPNAAAPSPDTASPKSESHPSTNPHNHNKSAVHTKRHDDTDIHSLVSETKLADTTIPNTHPSLVSKITPPLLPLVAVVDAPHTIHLACAQTPNGTSPVHQSHRNQKIGESPPHSSESPQSVSSTYPTAPNYWRV